MYKECEGFNRFNVTYYLSLAFILGFPLIFILFNLNALLMSIIAFSYTIMIIETGKVSFYRYFDDKDCKYFSSMFYYLIFYDIAVLLSAIFIYLGGW